MVLGTAQVAAGAQVTVRFDPPTKTVDRFDVFTIDLVADITEPVVGWGLDLTLDPAGIISLSGPPALGPSWLSAFASDGDGLAGLAFPDSVADVGVVLATLSFTADAVGQADLLAGYSLGDLAEGFPLDPGGFASVAFEIGHVMVVPEPAMIVLLAGGLFGLRCRRGRC